MVIYGFPVYKGLKVFTLYELLISGQPSSVILLIWIVKAKVTQTQGTNKVNGLPRGQVLDCWIDITQVTGKLQWLYQPRLDPRAVHKLDRALELGFLLLCFLFVCLFCFECIEQEIMLPTLKIKNN